MKNDFISSKEVQKIVCFANKELDLKQKTENFEFFVRNLSVIIFLDEYVIKLQKSNNSRNFQEDLVNKSSFNKCMMEWEALTAFYNLQKEKKFQIKIIKPVACIKKYNAIVTEKHDGIDFFEYIKKNKIDLGQRNEKIEKYFSRIGGLLADMHNKGGLKEVSGGVNIIEKIIRNINTENTFLEKKDKKKMSAELEKLKKNIKNKDIYSLNANGFQVRNILTDKSFKEVVLFDISKIEEESIYKIAGMFMASLKIIYQGDWRFPFRKVHNSYGEAFKKEYSRKIKNFNEELFYLYYFQQLLVLYRDVIKKNIKRKVPGEKILKKYYIDKVYLPEFYKILNKIQKYE